MRGRDAAVVIAAWGGLNVVLAALMFVFTDDLVSHLIWWLAILGLAPIVGAALLARDPGTRRLPEASGGAALAALALALVALGAGLGPWAVLCGAAVGVVAIVLLVLERSA
jgi:hypothetical protein